MDKDKEWFDKEILSQKIQNVKRSKVKGRIIMYKYDSKESALIIIKYLEEQFRTDIESIIIYYEYLLITIVSKGEIAWCEISDRTSI